MALPERIEGTYSRAACARRSLKVDARRHTQVRGRQFPRLPRDVALQPDGKVVAVPLTNGPGDGGVDILAIPSLERVARFQ